MICFPDKSLASDSQRDCFGLSPSRRRPHHAAPWPVPITPLRADHDLLAWILGRLAFLRGFVQRLALSLSWPGPFFFGLFDSLQVVRLGFGCGIGLVFGTASLSRQTAATSLHYGLDGRLDRRGGVLIASHTERGIL
ncbi:MAG: hypothetical protein P8L85_15720 [Rubripirellula sp.]|nr:hypothetical protein [Rubripirellula sp.]